MKPAPARPVANMVALHTDGKVPRLHCECRCCCKFKSEIDSCMCTAQLRNIQRCISVHLWFGEYCTLSSGNDGPMDGPL